MHNNNRTRRDNGFTLLELLIAIGLITVITFGAVYFGINPMMKNAQARALAERDKAITLLLDRYDVDSIEVHYEATTADRIIQRDQAGRLDRRRFQTELRAVLTIDGIRRPDCTIIGELTDDPRLECVDGTPTENAR